MKKISLSITAVLISIFLTSCAVQTALTSDIENYLPELSESLMQSSAQSSSESSSQSSVQSSSVSSTQNSPQSSAVNLTSEVSESTTSTVDTSSNIPAVKTPQFSTLFYDVTDNTLILGENTDEYIAPASLLKLLTASVALRYLSPDKVITVGTELELVQPYSSLCFISQGHWLTLYDLLTGMLLASGNDAAYTVAVSTAREVSGEELSDTEAVEYFTDMMNAFARELGMNNSHFVNPDGFDDERQYTTANDLLLLARYALTVPEIREITSTHQKYVVFESGHNITWTNSNKLLDPDGEFYCPGAIGLKTGTTANAGCNLIAAFEKDGKTYIAVAAGCKNDAARYKLVTDYYSRI